MFVAVHKAARLTQRQRATVRGRGKKARNAEQKRQWELAARNEPLFKRAFLNLMRSLFTEEMEKKTRRALAIPNATIETIIAAIPFFNPDDPETFATWQRFAVKLQDAYASAVSDASQAEIRRQGWKGVKVEVEKIAGPKSVLPTLPINPASADFVRQRSLSRAVQLSDDMKDTVRDILHDGFEAGTHPAAMVDEIKSTVGLTKGQRARVRAREKAMREAGFKREEINAARDEFSDQLRGMRAEAIARTETLDAQTQGLKDSWNQAKEEGLMPPGTKKKWVATNDERTSDICDELDGQEVGVDEQFDGPEGPLDGPPAHPNCRSTMVLVFPKE
jgi:SPP1 gp7 family putative phage head morphogenesis protein